MTKENDEFVSDCKVRQACVFELPDYTPFG